MLFRRKTALTPKQIRLFALLLQQDKDQSLLQEFANDLAKKNQQQKEQKERRILTRQGLPWINEIILPAICIFFSFASNSNASLIANNFYAVNNDKFLLSENLGNGDFVDFGESVYLNTIAVKGGDFQDIVKCIIWDRNFNFLTFDEFLPEPETAILLFNFDVLINEGKFGFSVYSSSGHLNLSDTEGFTVSPSNYLPTLHRAPRYSVGAKTLNVPEVLPSVYIWTAFLGMALIYGGRKLRNRK